MRSRKSLTISTLLAVIVFGIGVSLTSAVQQRREGDGSKYYKDWLNKDAVYIISDEERQFFKDLKNDEEKESFIQQFWDRRNPDPRSPYNAFKEEHYRRIAYANERFASGIPGWRTDRGRIYILWGPPDQKEEHPTGGIYYRSNREGGGSTSTFPFEHWWYRHIDGVGDDIDLEFVDSSISGEYRLAMSPEEKDALINVPGMGLTLAEEAGLADKRDRVYFNPSGWYDDNNANRYGRRTQDSPFSRMEQYFNVQRPPKVKFEDLKSVVTTHVTFDSLFYDVRTDYLRLSEDKVLVPITIEINNKEMEFKKEKEWNRAKLELYGIITGLTNKIHAEWEDVIARDFLDIYFDEGKEKKSEYQRIVALPPGQRYKLDLVLKDVNSKKVGTLSLGLNVPKYTDSGLQSSTIILANTVTAAPTNATTLDQYVIGDMRIVPNVKAEYVAGQNLIPYMQIYGMEIDQTSQKPSLEVEFVIKKGGKDGEVMDTIQSSAFNSEQFYYGQRVVLIGRVPIGKIAPGDYKLEIRVADRISTNRVTTTTDFKVKEPAPEVADIEP
ncbi:MAG: GWxTD domain-containing protein [Acidobacteriota bacterium]|jgi:GWxTD domain-containing protein|nr:GWxTD domain-containing protein [Acidobacteriota bacterium]